MLVRTSGVLAITALLACEGETGTPPGTLRFGQVGDVRLELSIPLSLGAGSHHQALSWTSDGPWTFTEEISYGQRSGDVNTTASTSPAGVLAGSYAVWVTQVNDIESLRLFIPELDPDLVVPCGTAETQVRLTIYDAVLDEQRGWTRCVEGTYTLGNLVTSQAGPDAAASRVANAAILIREYVFPGGFNSIFHASLPFGTLARGEDTPVRLDESMEITTAPVWAQFWRDHTGSLAGLPAVDFEDDIVLVAAVGIRPEAGEEVEVRRILPVGDGTVVEIVPRVPGNFCSPVARDHRPFHVVVAPRVQVPFPITFSQTEPEEVPCG